MNAGYFNLVGIMGAAVMLIILGLGYMYIVLWSIDIYWELWDKIKARNKSSKRLKAHFRYYHEFNDFLNQKGITIND